jgi:protein-tyrosine phosphatase
VFSWKKECSINMSDVPEVHRIDTIGQGYLAVMAQPASVGDLEVAIAALAAQGIQQVVSLLEPGEALTLGLEREAELVGQHSMRFLSFPIPDMGLPGSIDAFARLSRQLYLQIESGTNTLVHCRGGIGRSGLLAAAVLLQGGLAVQQAFTKVARKRGRQVPETSGQGTWLATNHAAIVAVTQRDGG